MGIKNNHPVGVDNNGPLGKDEAPRQDSNSQHLLRTAESNPRETSNEKRWREGAVANKGRDGEEDSKKEAELGLSFDQPDILKGLMAMFEGLDADCDGVLCREEVRARPGGSRLKVVLSNLDAKRDGALSITGRRSAPHPALQGRVRTKYTPAGNASSGLVSVGAGVQLSCRDHGVW